MSEDKKKKLKLSAQDRFSLQTIMPQKGSMIDQMIVKELVERVKLSEAEVKKIQVEPNKVKWDAVSARPYFFSATEMQFISTQADRLEAEKGVTQENLSLVLAIRNSMSKVGQ